MRRKHELGRGTSGGNLGLGKKVVRMLANLKTMWDPIRETHVSQQDLERFLWTVKV